MGVINHLHPLGWSFKYIWALKVCLSFSFDVVRLFFFFGSGGKNHQLESYKPILFLRTYIVGHKHLKILFWAYKNLRMLRDYPKIAKRKKNMFWEWSLFLWKTTVIFHVFFFRCVRTKGHNGTPPGLENINMNGPCVGFGSIPPTLATGVS